MKKNQNIDDLFRDKLLNYEQEPPASLLEKILAGAESARLKRNVVFWRAAGVAAALLLAFVAGWQLNYMNSETVVPPVLVSRSKTPETKTEMTSKVIDEPRMATNETRKTQVPPEINAQAAANRTLVAISRITDQYQKTAPKTTGILLAHETEVFKPLKRLTRLISEEDRSVVVLQEKKVRNTKKELEARSIDQQIMDQNKQMMLAQDESLKKNRWLVGAQVSPAYSVSRSNHSQVYASNMLSSSSSKPVELGGGVSVQYRSGKRWSLQSGVYYSALGQTSGNSSSSGKNSAMAENGSKYLNAPVNIEANKIMMNSAAGVIEFSSIPSGMVLGTSIEDKSLVSTVVVSDARFIQNFEYIEIPLYLRYTIFDSRFDVEMLGGFSSNLLVGNQTFMESNSDRSLVGKTKDMEALNYSGTLGIGLKYGLSKRIFLNVEPRIKYYLNSLNSNSAVTYKAYTIGVYTGLSYEF